MDLLPDLGSWLLRSVRRDHFTDSPVFAVERLNTLPRPLRDADKEILVGAVLTMSSSLTLALGMLQELLPQEKSQERLGEVLCPTLGHLVASLQSTLSSFDWKAPPQSQALGLSASPAANTPERIKSHVPDEGAKYKPAPGPARPATAIDERLIAPLGWPNNRPAISSSGLRPSSRPATSYTERFPPLQRDVDGEPNRQLQIKVDVQSRPETQLAKALQAEMRVQAAIHVAIESLEFAESQLKVVKEVNQLHGGNFDILQKHFYAGYNRLLVRALELQRRELGLLQDGDSPIPLPSVQSTPRRPLNGYSALQRSLHRQPSVSFDTCPTPTPRLTGVAHAGDPERRPLGRRNTIQGIRPEDSRTTSTRPPLKRRLSLAEELAMVGEDSENGYQDETPEIEPSSESDDDSDTFETGSEPRDMMARERGEESEEYSTN
ncbi:hypothetical protein C8A03DRAFT_39043, partial [Achaetomium macrosporum]